MPDNDQPWLGDFATQSNAQMHQTADVSKLMNAEPPAVKKRGYHRYELPESVMESEHWTGCDADRFFGIWEPGAGEVRSLIKQEAEFNEASKNFIAALGVGTPPMGIIQRGPPDEHYPEGEPMLRDVTDNTAQVMPWWARLSSKGQALITSVFMEMIMPTEEEGKSLRASRKWVG